MNLFISTTENLIIDTQLHWFNKKKYLLNRLKVFTTLKQINKILFFSLYHSNDFMLAYLTDSPTT